LAKQGQAKKPVIKRIPSGERARSAKKSDSLDIQPVLEKEEFNCLVNFFGQKCLMVVRKNPPTWPKQFFLFFCLFFEKCINKFLCIC